MSSEEERSQSSEGEEDQNAPKFIRLSDDVSGRGKKRGREETSLDEEQSEHSNDDQSDDPASSKAPPKKKRKNNKNKKPKEPNVFDRGESIAKTKRITNKRVRGKVERNEKTYKAAAQSAYDAQILLTQQGGYLEAEGMEKTTDFSQASLLPYVDLQTATKMFDLSLDQLGPYTIDYSANGRDLLLCGKKGHVAMLNWTTKKLLSELHLNETCHDIKFLHDNTFFAVAQKKYAYIYDQNGVEIHRLKDMTSPLALEFLPHHFLLVVINEGGCLRYQDTSIGRLVANIYTKCGPTKIITQNPWNSVIHLGHHNGSVTMWTPNTNEYCMKVQCHMNGITSMAVDQTGKMMVTAGRDNRMKVWDIRHTYQSLFSYTTRQPAISMDLSHRGVLSIAGGSTVLMYKDVLKEQQTSPYMIHQDRFSSVMESVKFCPYEDILGVGHSEGFTSCVVPGSGEPNFDSYVANPYQTTRQRNEATVRKLLDKIQPEMIVMDPTKIGTLDDDIAARHKQLEDEHAAKMEGKNPKKEKNKMRGKNTSSKRVLKKQQNVWDEKKELKKKKSEKQEIDAVKRKKKKNKEIPSSLSRFQ